MDTYKHKFTKLQNEIFSFLCLNSEKEFSKREISKGLKVSPTAIANSLVLLEKEKLVLVNNEGNINFSKVSLNRQSQEVINLKRVENLKNVYSSGLFNFLFDKFPGATIVLFGSYSFGEDIFSSDIDIAIIGVKEKIVDLRKFERLFGKDIRLSFYGSWKKIEKNLRENILRGIILSGGVEL